MAKLTQSQLQYHNLALAYPKLAKEWHPTRNKNGLTPINIAPRSSRKVWWVCEKGHEWEASVSNRTNGTGCPFCANRMVAHNNSLAYLFPDLLKEWHQDRNGILTPSDVVAGSIRKVWWICGRGHEWRASIRGRSKQGKGCPYCYSRTSRLQLRLYCELKSIFDQAKHRAIVSGAEVDIFIPQLSLGIEIDSLYWHKNKVQKERTKDNLLTRNGIRLIRLREKGLVRISDSDIYFSSKESHLAIIHRLVRQICHKEQLDDEFKRKLSVYLKKKTLQKEDEYRQLQDRLPRPLQGASLQELYPNLAREWHPIKNGAFLASDAYIGSGEKVWWECNSGHEWQARIQARVRGTGCPFCSRSSRALALYNPSLSPNPSLENLYPNVALEWHPTRNRPIEPKNVTPHSHYNAWWKCKYGHEWQAYVYNRIRRKGCPICASLKSSNPDLAMQWHPSKNGNVKPNGITGHSRKKFWWLCPRGHEWEATVDNRAKGQGCPYCAGKIATEENCLQGWYPVIAKEWHPTRNAALTPRDVTKSSNKTVWWVCGKGHEWEATVNRRTRGAGCPYCSGKRVCNDNSLALLNPSLAMQWHRWRNGTLRPSDVTLGSNKKVWWVCGKGHEWQATVNHRNSGTGCPYCFGRKSVS